VGSFLGKPIHKPKINFYDPFALYISDLSALCVPMIEIMITIMHSRALSLAIMKPIFTHRKLYFYIYVKKLYLAARDKCFCVWDEFSTCSSTCGPGNMIRYCRPPRPTDTYVVPLPAVPYQVVACNTDFCFCQGVNNFKTKILFSSKIQNIFIWKVALTGQAGPVAQINVQVSGHVRRLVIAL